MHQRRTESYTRVPITPLRVVIEDPDLTDASFDDFDTAGMDVRICSGPLDPPDRCPLVTDGTCPLGTPDVVVCRLDHPWEHAVVRAWEADGVVLVRTAGPPVGQLERRLSTSLGEALSAMWDQSNRLES